MPRSLKIAPYDPYILFVVELRQTHLARILGGHVIYEGIDLTWKDAHDSERCHIERYTRARLEISPAHLVERIQKIRKREAAKGGTARGKAERRTNECVRHVGYVM